VRNNIIFKFQLIYKLINDISVQEFNDHGDTTKHHKDQVFPH